MPIIMSIIPIGLCLLFIVIIMPIIPIGLRLLFLVDETTQPANSANILHIKLSQVRCLPENDFKFSVTNEFGNLNLKKNDRISI